ncbi:MAG: ABC transporter ATP-binding protein [Leptolyngbyaceae bacterium]|nr:ABC transporter ATP-binding protein [Leptolyngbyaceae bacterium]
MPRSKSLKLTLPGIGRILKQFMPQIAKEKRLLWLSFLALLLETAMRLLEPWPLKFMFDRVILPGFDVHGLGVEALEGWSPMALLTLLALSLVAISGLRGAAAYGSTVGMAIAATRIMADIRAHLYSHIQKLSLSFHSRAKSGDLITRVTYDIERLREVTVVAALPLLTNLLTLVGMMVIMFFLNLELALIAVMVLPMFALSTLKMSTKIQSVARRQRKREGAMAASAAEAIAAIKVVQALGLQEQLESSFATHNQKSLRESAEAQKLRAGQERLVEVLVAVATALVLWRGVQLTLEGRVTPGDLLVFITYLKVAFKPMRQLAKYTGQIAKATASGERIIDILNTVPDVRDLRGATSAPPFRGSVQFDQVSFGYSQETGVLKQINFEIEPGQRIALVGPSGGGKSTLISLLMRFYDPTEGRICIDGHDVREYTLDSLRNQISIVLQESVLFATSVRENIAYGLVGAKDSAIEAAARQANAHDFIMALPSGYDTVLGERGATLSGGQRQRIAIARAAIRNAPIIVLDEPTTGLDNESDRLVTDALNQLTEGKTTILISHDLRSAETADKVFYLEQGSILEQGSHEALMGLNQRYARLYSLQTTHQSSSTAVDAADSSFYAYIS